MKKILKPFRAIIRFVVFHPIWSMLITWVVITFIDGYDTMKWNFIGCWFITLFIFALLSPFIRNARIRIARKQEMDYFAEKMALEQDRLAHPEKYQEK